METWQLYLSDIRLASTYTSRQLLQYFLPPVTVVYSRGTDCSNWNSSAQLIYLKEVRRWCEPLHAKLSFIGGSRHGKL